MKTKALISDAVTAKLICVFVFAYANCWFSHDAALSYFKMFICCDRVGLDSKKRIFSEKRRKDAKRGEKRGKDGKRGYYVREKCI